MPATDSPQPSHLEGYEESPGEWVDRNLDAVRWLMDNHAAIRARLAAPSTPEPAAHVHQECGVTAEELWQEICHLRALMVDMVVALQATGSEA